MAQAPLPPAEEVPQEHVEFDDYGAEARAAALADGSGASPFVSRIATGQAKLPFTLAQNPPRFAEPAPRPRRWSTKSSRAAGVSGVEVGRRMANEKPGPGSTSEGRAEARRIFETSRVPGAALDESVEESIQPKSVWLDKKGRAENIRAVMTERRARFIVSTWGEASLASKIMGKLHPTEVRRGIDLHLSSQTNRFGSIFRAQEGNKDDLEGRVHARVKEEVMEYGEYAKDAADKLTALKTLQDTLATQPKGTTLGEVFYADRDNDKTKAQIQRGVVTVLQHAIVREVAQKGESSTGVDPLLNLGTNFEEVLEKLAAGDTAGDTNTAALARYMQEMMKNMSVTGANKQVYTTGMAEARRYNFWSRVLISIQGVHKSVAEDILANRIWQN